MKIYRKSLFLHGEKLTLNLYKFDILEEEEILT